MGRREVIFSVIAAGAALLAFSRRNTKKPRSYKMTVEVNTPSGPRSGSGVRGYLATSQHGANGRSTHTRLRGEAVVVDLPNGRSIFALLRGGFYHWGEFNGLMMIAANRGTGGRVNEPVEIYPTTPPDPRDQPPSSRFYVKPEEWLPFLATFADEHDPATVTQLTPPDFSSEFGPGYSLARITVHITDEAIQWSIRERLPWLFGDGGLPLIPGNQGRPYDALSGAERLDYRDFFQNPPR